MPVVQRRKQSDHLFGLLLEICHISPAETQLLLRSGTISRWVEAQDRGKVGLQHVGTLVLLRVGLVAAMLSTKASNDAIFSVSILLFTSCCFR